MRSVLIGLFASGALILSLIVLQGYRLPEEGASDVSVARRVADVVSTTPDVDDVPLHRPTYSSLMNGLIHYWRLDDGVGDAKDAIGFLVLANKNNAAFTSGKVNGGIDVNVDSVQHFHTLEDVRAGTLSAYTACGWVSLDSVPTPQNSYHMFGSFDTPGSFELAYVQFDGITRLQMRQFDNEGPYTAFYNISLPLHVWHFFCGTWDGLRIQLYLNGEPVGEPVPISIMRTRERYGTAIGAAASNDLSWDGKLDEIGLWERALTPSEIWQLYNNGVGLSYPF